MRYFQFQNWLGEFVMIDFFRIGFLFRYGCLNFKLIIFLQLHIWDFSGRTSQFFVNDGNNLSIDSPGQSRQVGPVYHVIKFLNLIFYKHN